MNEDKTAEQLRACRGAFERDITSPPYELSVSRYPDNETSAWPGNYRDYKVELAWCMFQAAWNTRQDDPNFPNELDELRLTLIEVTEERDHLRSVLANTRADSGEAVSCLDYTHPGVPVVTWFKPMNPGKHELFTHPRATAVDADMGNHMSEQNQQDARDAERYRWLRGLPRNYDGRKNGFHVTLAIAKDEPNAWFVEAARDLKLDEAIDAAIASREGEGK